MTNEEAADYLIRPTDGYWYHGNGKIGGEFHPTKPNDEERYGEYVKVKHGRWKKVVHSNNNITHYCSECKSVFYKGCADQGEYNFCPNCGAKMDGEKNV